MATVYATSGATGASGANTNTWTGVHDSSGGKGGGTFGNATDSVAIRSRTFGGGNVGIFRLFMEFDTSGISSAPSATLNIKGFGSDTTTNPSIIVIKGTQSSPYNANTLNDFTGWQSGWNNTHVTAYSGEHNSAWSTSAYNSITLNATALSDIEAGHTFKVCIMTYEYDYQDIQPGAGVDVCAGVVLDESGTSQDPYLETAAVGYANNVIGVASANIGSINGIATADISKINGT